MRRYLGVMGLLMLVLAVGLTAKPAMAVPIDPFNDRPAAIGSSGETTLQTILNNQYGPGTVNASTDQQSTGMWSAPASLLGAKLVAEFAGYASNNIFGIWSGTDTTSLTHVDIFNGAAQSSPAIIGVAGLGWLSTGQLAIIGLPGFVNAGVYDGIDQDNFGFYLRRSGATTVYTVDQLNPAGLAMALAYNPTGTFDWTIAFEDVVGGDRDYNDQVVRLKGIVPVVPAPEPASILLMGSGLAALGLWKRRRS